MHPRTRRAHTWYVHLRRVCGGKEVEDEDENQRDLDYP